MSIKSIWAWKMKNAYILVFALSALGMVGSLYYSEFLGLTPCLLCWYQRITLYPIVLISAIAIWNDDRKAYRYILPLIIIGTLISLYQNGLYYGILPEKIAPCTAGVSCTTRYESWLAWLPIPLQALGAHLAILGLMVFKRREETKTV